jgi:hypothetical protein
MNLERIDFEASGHDNLVNEVFTSESVTQALTHLHTEQWNVDSDTAEIMIGRLEDEGVDIIGSSNESGHSASFYLDNVLVKVRSWAGNIYASYASKTRLEWEDAHSKLQDLFPSLNPEVDHKIAVNFWSCGTNGASNNRRQIVVPNWLDVNDNYPPEVAAGVEQMLDPTFKPGDGGKLILWHGDPGGGKTYAIRALGWEWRKWCSMHYITDPETFFGDASYMLQVMLGYDDPYDLAEEDGKDEKRERWKLIVIEDAGELLSPDARERTGQSLSRLLNVTEGLIGQGMQVMILITTNEPLRNVHPAVGRDGRCAIDITFEALEGDEVKDWLDRHQVDVEPPKKATLAELYALKKGNPQKRKAKVGFSA